MKEEYENKIPNGKSLLIAYEFNYHKTIKQTLKNAGYRGSIFVLPNNIELYKKNSTKSYELKFEPVYEEITKKVKSGRFDNFILDVPNLYCNSSYDNTKQIIKYLSSNGKLLLMVNGPLRRFEKIFGEDYSSMIIDSKYMIRHGNDTITKNIIHSIL